MGFEELATELHKSAESEGRKLIAAAEKNAHKYEEEAKEKAEELLRDAKKDAQAYSKQESAERLTSAKLAAKKIVDEARDDAVEASLHQVWNAFKASSLKKATYPALLQKLIADGIRELGSNDAVVYVRDEDKPLVAGYKTAKLPAQYTGGAILESANGKIRVNRTLEEVFAQKKSEMRKKIYDSLFG
ncbi:MAG: V-type ATP synthase subunit E family protein [Candidatus Micrarchaeota archaeon]|nr:V-type ATP synthase subunit E family protein [Candidatus Micrarchaeota archaeon]